METDPNHIVRAVLGVAFFIVLIGGGYVVTNFNRPFGPDPSIPSEAKSGRTYGKVQAVVVWLHAVAVTGALALALY